MSNAPDLRLVIGSGATGLAVVDELLRRGCPVRVVNRSGQADVPPGVEVVGGDAADPAFVREAAQGAGVVYNCIGLPYTEWVTRFLPVTEAIISGVGAAGARLAQLDNLYLYGQPTGPMTEGTLPRPISAKDRTRAAVAERLLAAHHHGEVQVVIGRASDYFGPRGVANSHLGGRVLYPALAGRGASLIGQIDLPHTFSYLPDIGRTLVMLGEDEAAYGGVWHLPNPRTITPRELANLCYTAAGQTPQVSARPKLLLQIGGLFNPMLREILAEYHQWSVPYIVDDTKFTAAYGDQATPLNQAVEETVAWFRAHPQ